VERLAAFTYRYTGEQLWVGRVYSSLFWLAGGLFLYMLARSLGGPPGALFSLAIYLLLPYAVIASRSFQPDPLMVMFIVTYWWALERWGREPDSLRWGAAAGLLGGLAILIKFPAAFFVIPAGIGVLLGRRLLPGALHKPAAWWLVALGALPGLAYLIYGVWIAGFLGRQFGGRFIPSLLLNPSYYLNWIGTLDHIFGILLVALALLGLFLLRDRATRIFMLALWVGYLLYGLYFDYHIWSHDYYNLPLIPLVALSLGPLADALAASVGEAVSGSKLKQLAVLALFGGAVFGVIWQTRTLLKSVDYRPEAAMWAEIGEKLGPGARLAALTQDYGSRLAYWGWLEAAAWPVAGDISYHGDLLGADQDFEKRFRELALKRDFFLVTLPDELKLQPQLQARLAEYPIFGQGEGYVIYDLR
jgi:4-amino-4-deoxy-L-arabinose transferase-like glycosyltransferase